MTLSFLLPTQEERLLDNPDIAAVLDLLTAESNEVRHLQICLVHSFFMHGGRVCCAGHSAA